MLLHRFNCLLILILSFLCCPVQANDTASEQGSEVTAIKQLFTDYMAHYNGYMRGESLEGIEQLYMPTITLMSTVNAPQSVPAQTFVEQVTGFLDGLKQQGVVVVSWQDVNVRLLDSNIALASNLATRYNKTGDIVNQVGATYLLYKQENQWRIASFAVHAHTGIKPL